MSHQINTNHDHSSPLFQTPLKKIHKPRHLLLTNDQSYQKQHPQSHPNPNSIPISHPTTMNIFQRKKYTKTLKKCNLQLLAHQSLKLAQMKTKIYPSDHFKQSYKNQLDQVFVILARISHIQEDKKYYSIFCQDQSHTNFKLYFLKHIPSEKPGKHSSKSELKTRKITDLDSLEFQPKFEEGTPYFKFFVIFREIPVFQNDQNKVMNREEPSSRQDSQKSQEKTRKPNVKPTEFRVYVENFEKVEDFNYLTFHNMHIISEELYLKKVLANKMEIFQDD